MGNEQAIPEKEELPLQKLQQIQNQAKIQSKPRKFTHEILINIRGQRRTGKTTLVQRMTGGKFNEEYTPTPFLEVSQIPFQPESLKTDILSVKVMDVVEHALIPYDTVKKMLYPDSTTIDTYKHADGIVVMIDTRHNDTIELAVDIIKNAPLDLPIVVFSNFMDNENVVPTMPDMLQELIGRFTYIPGSLRSNLGLFELSQWLMIPYKFSKKKEYLAMYNMISEELDDDLRESHERAANFISLELARENMPKPPTRPVKKESARTIVKSNSLEKPKKQNLNDDFFSSDNEEENDLDILKKKAMKEFYGETKANPLVQTQPTKQKPIVKQQQVQPKETIQQKEPIKEQKKQNEVNSTKKPTLFEKPLDQYSQEVIPTITDDKDDDNDIDFFASDDDKNPPKAIIKQLPPIQGTQTTKINEQKQRSATEAKDLPRRRPKKLHRK